MTLKIMVVTAHPDDAEFSCGGSVARWARDGCDVIYVVCTNGDKGSGDLQMTSERLAVIREAEQRAAARALGVKEVVFLGYPDGSLEDTSEFRGKLVRLIRRHQPQRLVTMDPFRRFHYHRDHRVTGIVALDACFPYARDHLHFAEHLKEGLLPHKVQEAYLSSIGMEDPDVIVDISDTFEQKIQALLCHASQVPGEAVLRERMFRFASDVGERNGVPLAESFKRIEFRL